MDFGGNSFSFIAPSILIDVIRIADKQAQFQNWDLLGANEKNSEIPTNQMSAHRRKIRSTD